jgi:hypothetical protein
MKTISLLAAISLIAVFASPAVAREQVPFKGSLALVQTGEVQGGFFVVEGSGVGNATKLGRYSVTFHEQVDLSAGTATGTYDFVAANGDILAASFVGHGTPTPDPSLLLLDQVGTITGGTGRFAGATGTFTLEGVVNLITLNFIGSFDGTISRVGSH